jgi:acetylornithine deacetylase/succinyl-diaminopimelate desuccinylase-like protein
VRRSADATAALFRDAGLGDVRLLELDGAHPAVFGCIAAPKGAPTVLLYAHHDVQPPGEDDGWDGKPFEPFERDGRLYGRGSSDDKCGIVTHTGVVRAFGGRPPVGIKVFVEGEEEIGSDHLPELISRYGELLAADVIVIADSGNWRAGTPALTVSLRGIISVIVDVQVLKAGVE